MFVFLPFVIQFTRMHQFYGICTSDEAIYKFQLNVEPKASQRFTLVSFNHHLYCCQQRKMHIRASNSISSIRPFQMKSSSTYTKKNIRKLYLVCAVYTQKLFHHHRHLIYHSYTVHNNTRLHKQHENMLTLLPIMMVSCFSEKSFSKSLIFELLYFVRVVEPVIYEKKERENVVY